MKGIILLIASCMLLCWCGDENLHAQTRKEKKKVLRKQAEELLIKERQVAEERAALKELYWCLNGDNWTNNNNWLSDKPVEDWAGMKRNYDTGKLSIYLVFNGLKGNLPTGIFNLKTVEVLNLCHNNITGNIPPSVGKCLSLTQ